MRIRQPKKKPEPEYPNEIHFIAYGDAVPKARARVVTNKKDDPSAGKHAFTPKTTVEWEASIYGQSLASRPPYPWRGGIALGVVFYKKIPKSKRKKWLKSEGCMRPVGARDDYDNLIKTAKDALNGIYWLDDGQVVEYIPVIIDGEEVKPGKYFSDIPRVEVRVVFLDEF